MTFAMTYAPLVPTAPAAGAAPLHPTERLPGTTQAVRKVTDRCGASCCCLCMVILAAMMVFAGFYGDPPRLIDGVDYQGRVCGVDEGVIDTPFMYWCGIEDADHHWANDGLEFPPTLNFHAKVCVATCPTREAPQIINCLQPNDAQAERGGRSTAIGGLTTIESFGIAINQFIEGQTSYPTVASDRMCLPDGDHRLQYNILHDAIGHGRSAGTKMGSIIDAWWILMAIGVGAILFNYMFLVALRYFAGIILFFQLVLTTIITIMAGFFFIAALADWTNDPEIFYQKINPWYHVYTETASRAVLMSTLTGIVFLVVGIALGCASIAEVAHIDEVVGVCVAALDCVFSRPLAGTKTFGGATSVGKGTGDLLGIPLLISLLQVGFAGLLLHGSTYVWSIGQVDTSMIRYNGDYIVGLYRRLDFEWYTDWMMMFYCFCAIWILEFCTSLGQFMTSYCVAQWYYLKVTEVGGAKKPEGRQKHVQTRVNGKSVHGIVTTDKHGVETMEVHGDHMKPGWTGDQPAQWHKEEMRRFLFEALQVALRFHFGSLAKGSLAIVFTRPIRIVPHVTKSIMVRKGNKKEEHPVLGKGGFLSGVCGLLGTSLYTIIGFFAVLFRRWNCFSKDAYLEVVLSSRCFFEAGTEAHELVSHAGGVVAFFMGSLAFFELVGSISTFVSSFFLTLLVFAYFPAFDDPTHFLFVADPGFLAIMAAVLCTMITNTFIMMLSHTADSLFFTFARNRHHDETHRKNTTKDYIPGSLKHLVGGEVKARPDVQAEGNRADHYYHHGPHMFHNVLQGPGNGHGH